MLAGIATFPTSEVWLGCLICIGDTQQLQGEQEVHITTGLHACAGDTHAAHESALTHTYLIRPVRLSVTGHSGSVCC